MRYLIIMLMTVAMVGCNKSDTPNPIAPSMPDGYEPSTTDITFATEINWGDDETQTRGLETTNENIKDFGVFAYYGNKDADFSTLTPNFMYNQEVTKKDDSWIYSPIKYWSNNENDRLQFFAYHPYGSDEIVLSENSEVGYPTLTVTPANKPYDQDDFIVAHTDKLGKSDEGVKLSFKHKLAQARIYAARLGDKEDGETVQILGMTVSGFTASGVLQYSAKTKDLEWSLPDRDTKATYSFNREKELSPDVKLPPLSAPSNKVGDYKALGYGGLGTSYMMLIPDDDVGELNFSVLFSYESTEGKAQAFQEFTLAKGSDLKEGEVKIYLLFIDPSDVGFGTITVTSQAWKPKNLLENPDDPDDKWEIE